jgi:hypothetical protein
MASQVTQPADVGTAVALTLALRQPAFATPTPAYRQSIQRRVDAGHDLIEAVPLEVVLDLPVQLRGVSHLVEAVDD